MGTQFSEVQLIGTPYEPQRPRIQIAMPCAAAHPDQREVARSRDHHRAPLLSLRNRFHLAACGIASRPRFGKRHFRLEMVASARWSFGGVADERLQLNEDTLWDGYPLDASNPDSLKVLPEVRRLLFEGKNKEAEALAAANMMGRPSRVKPVSSLGELWMEFPGRTSATNYHRSLDLNTAIARTSYQSDGVVYNREVFSSAPSQVLVTQLTASQPSRISFQLTLKRQKDAVCVAHPD
jgi:hypothetical protein